MPTPIDKMLIIVQAFLLAVSSLLLGSLGATYVALAGGLLTTIWKTGFAPISLIFAVSYGLLIDGLFYFLKVRALHGEVKTNRIVASLTLSTAAVGLLSTYITVIMGFMPMIPFIYLTIVVVGVASGAAAGYITAFLWKRYLIRYSGDT